MRITVNVNNLIISPVLYHSTKTEATEALKTLFKLTIQMPQTEQN